MVGAPAERQSAGMPTCAICQHPVAERGLVDEDAGRGFHTECLAGRLPADAAATLLAVLVVAAIPAIAVWAA